MRLNHTIRYISLPSRVLMYLVIFLAGLMFLQYILPGIIMIIPPARTPPDLPEQEPTESELQQKRISNSRKEFLPDGTVHLLCYAKDGYEVRDVNSNVLWKGKHNDDIPYKYLSWPMHRLGGWDFLFEQHPIIASFFVPAQVVHIVSHKDKLTRNWRYEREKGCFVGTDSDGRNIGYMGAGGVEKSKNDVKPFEKLESMTAFCSEDSCSPVVLCHTEQRIYKVDFQTGVVEVIFDAQNKGIYEINEYKWLGMEKRLYDEDSDTTDYRPAMCITLKKGGLFLLLRDPNEQIAINTPSDWDIDRVSVAARKEKILLKYEGMEGPPPPRNHLLQIEEWEKKYRSKPYQQWIELYQVDGRGDLKLINRFEWTHPLEKYHRTDKLFERYHNARYYVKTLSSPLLDFVLHRYYKEKLYSDTEDKSGGFMASAFLDGPDYYKVTNRPLNWTLSLLMACVVLWHGWARRTNWGGFVFWIIFTGAFNLAGLLTYLTLNHTPVISCPNCGKKRGLQKPDCVHCGSILPSPRPGKFDLIFTNVP